MILDQIIKKYEDNLGELTPKKRLHWLVRYYRITGDSKYIPLIYSTYLEILPRIKKFLDIMQDEEKINNLGLKMIGDYKSNTVRKIKRFAYYQKNPKMLVYMENITYMFLLKSLGLEETSDISNIFKKTKEYFEKMDVGNLFLEKEFMIVNPSQSANMIYCLNFLGIADYRMELIKQSKEYWLNVEPKEQSIWTDKIYALTHLIIAASNYYQNFVDKNQFDWTFDYFEKNLDTILKNASLDGIGEVALCFKLAKDENNAVIQKIKDFLIAKYDEKLGFIPNEKDLTFSASEHRNIVAVMVLKDFDSLYKGPNLQSILT